MKQYLFISPHLDDVILSCGVYIHRLVKAHNKVDIITIFSGSKDTLSLSPLAKNFNKRCKLKSNAMKVRRYEDIKACKILKAQPIHLNLHECLYRENDDGNPRYLKQKDIFRSNLTKEIDTINLVNTTLIGKLDLNKYHEIYAPLGIGRHIDHLVTRNALEKLLSQNKIKKIKYYEDIPYVCHNRDKNWRIELTNGLTPYTYSFSKRDFRIYLKAMSFYKSQRKVLWYTKRIKMSQLLNYYKRESNHFEGELWAYLSDQVNVEN